MPAPERSLPTRDEELDLHRRLVAGDLVASSELCEAYLVPLIGHLRKTNRGETPQEMVEDAAGDALLSLIKNATAFDPARNRGELPLWAYLKLAARRDLQNILKKEERHGQGRASLESVEQSPHAWKYLCVQDDPSKRLQLREEATRADGEILFQVRQGLTTGEQRVLALILEGERRTAVFAQALGIDQWPQEEQEAKVKRVKDKLKRRIARANDGRAS